MIKQLDPVLVAHLEPGQDETDTVTAPNHLRPDGSSTIPLLWRSVSPRPRFAVDVWHGPLIHGTVAAQPPETVMTLRALVLAQLVMFHTAQWSPDGAQLLVTTMDNAEQPAFIYDLARDDLRPISSGRLRELERDWVPHPREPQVTEQRTSSGQVIMLHTGSGRPRVLSHERWAEQPGLSPDGSYVVYEARENPHDVLSSWIVIVDTAGDARRRIHLGTDPSWAPDGASIAFKTPVDGVLHIATARIDGGSARILTPGVHPAWSPNGRRIAYMVDGAGRADIWIMNSDGSSRKCVTCSVR
jgi:Tol biopolymer transport system component